MDEFIHNWLNKNALNENKNTIILKIVVTFRIDFKDAKHIYEQWRKNYMKAKVI